MPDRVRIYTYKEGLLSRVAHDLRLHVEPRGVTITRSDDQVSADIDPAAIVVDGAMRGDRLDESALSPGDRSRIESTIRTEIVAVGERPANIRFEGKLRNRGDRAVGIDGQLELVRVRKPLVFTATRTGDRLVARVTLRPSDWGIAPYKALLGAIRLQDRVVVELDIEDRWPMSAASSRSS